jgi:protein-tyrosine phosphatase
VQTTERPLRLAPVIDLHCHILPGLDDGARDLEDSVEMGRQAGADGIELVCATPHIRHDHAVRTGELAQRVAALNEELERSGLRVRVTTGGEVAETIVDELSPAELARVSLAGAGRWILLEPGPGALSDSLIETAASLGRAGYRSIVAHPERHLDDAAPERLGRLVQQGALVQVTAAYLAEAAPGAVLELAERGLVHLLGSDSHSARYGRPVRLSDAVARLRGIDLLASHVEWIVRTAPAAIVRGEDVEPPFPSS